MTYTDMFGVLSIYFMIGVVCVIAYLLLKYLVYGLVCILAWVEDEWHRLVQDKRRKKRLRERAKKYKAGVKQ